MNIEAITTPISMGAPKVTPQTTQPKSESETGVRDSLMTEQSGQLMGALRNQPDVRPEMVARGKTLAADPNYPSDDVISQIAKLFATQ